MKMNPQSFKLENCNCLKPLFFVGVLGILASCAGYALDRAQLFHSFLVAFIFWMTLALGSLFFTMLQHLTGARWSVVLRRIPETVMSNLPGMLVFLVPLFFGIPYLFHWSHADVVAKDHLLQHKAPYLNVQFFVIRSLVFFAVWWLLSRALYRNSVRQDAGNQPGLTSKMHGVSAPGMILFALTSSFFAFDWVMSLDAHWYSTMFGVYIFAGSVLSSIAFITIIVFALRRHGVLSGQITVEHHHDLGKLMFAFTIFWSYITFCQYLLIWYSSIPEETVWYFNRWQGSWKSVSILIILGHFALPFIVLLGRDAKRSTPVLVVISLWLLLMHYVDLYWLVMPNLHPTGMHVSWMDLSTMVGIGCIFLWWIGRRFTQQALMPLGDPSLKDSLEFQNA